MNERKVKMNVNDEDAAAFCGGIVVTIFFVVILCLLEVLSQRSFGTLWDMLSELVGLLFVVWFLSTFFLRALLEKSQ